MQPCISNCQSCACASYAHVGPSRVKWIDSFLKGLYLMEEFPEESQPETSDMAALPSDLYVEVEERSNTLSLPLQ